MAKTSKVLGTKKGPDPKKVGAITVILVAVAVIFGALVVSARLASTKAPTAPESQPAAYDKECEDKGSPGARVRCRAEKEWDRESARKKAEEAKKLQDAIDARRLQDLEDAGLNPTQAKPRSISTPAVPTTKPVTGTPTPKPYNVCPGCPVLPPTIPKASPTLQQMTLPTVTAPKVVLPDRRSIDQRIWDMFIKSLDL